LTVRHYTVEEANAALPGLRALIQEMWKARSAILAAQPELAPVLNKAANNGGSRLAGEMLAEFQRFQQAVRDIQAMGCLLKDVERGLVDFLSRRDDREVYLCWHYGEEQVTFWHEIQAGFSGRQLL